MPEMGKPSCFSRQDGLTTVFFIMARTYTESNKNAPPMTLILKHILFILY
jgi:hypothetical protein